MDREENAALESWIEIFKMLRDGGWEPPIHFAAIGMNGSIMGGTIRQTDDGWMTDFHVEHLADGERLGFPINLMFVSHGKEAAHVVIQPGKDLRWN